MHQLQNQLLHVAALALAGLFVTSSACSKKNAPAAVMGNRYPDNHAFVAARLRRVGLPSLKQRERVVHHIFALETEIGKGGFFGFFGSEAGDYIGSTVEDLQRIGASKLADTLRKARTIAFEGQLPPIDREERAARLQRSNAHDESQLIIELGKLDVQWDTHSARLTDKMNVWLKANK